MTIHDCIKVIENAGLPIPPKSAEARGATMTHDRAACEFCRAVTVLDDAMANVEMMPEFGVQRYDDAIAAVLDAIENAAHELRCWEADRKEQPG